MGFTLLTACGATTRSSADDGGTSTSTSTSNNSVGAEGTAGTPDVSPAWLACSESPDCTVTFAGCCPSCDEGSVENSIAIAKSSVEAYRADACGEASVCPRCFAIPNPYLQASCVEGTCTLVDINTPDYVSCSESSDCMLRTAACCPCDESQGRIAISAAAEGAYSQLVCGQGPSCPTCAGGEVTDLDALCHEGRCIERGFEF